MSLIDPSLIADVAVALLLVAVIGFAVQLNRRLVAWRESSGEMERRVAELTQALSRAEAALGGMKGIVRDEVAGLEKAQKQAQSLRDDLRFLEERGGVLADRLEQQLRKGLAAVQPLQPADEDRPAPRPAAPRPVDPRPAEPRLAGDRPLSPTSDRPISNAERELLKALEAMR